MSDYIKRKVALEAILNLYDVFVNNLPPLKYATDVQDAINGVPSADAVEVIRCKDCIYADTYLARPKRVFCCKFGENMEQTDFCSFGEKKDE